MMSASCGAKNASIRQVVRELAERPDWNVDRQTDRRTAFQLYIYRFHCFHIRIDMSKPQKFVPQRLLI